MYNVDQQLFSYCTAKFSDNTQCCVPVFDITHELPLCHEHSVKVVSGCCGILSLAASDTASTQLCGLPSTSWSDPLCYFVIE